MTEPNDLEWATAVDELGGTLPTRFWAKVDRSGDCWLWMGARGTKLGYGAIKANGHRPAPILLAHRVSWVLANGPIPAGLCVLHRCDNPPCVRPEHLFLGTHADNAADRDAKGRTAARLTSNQVVEIRAAYASGLRQKAIARRYGVASSTIDSIVNGHNWRTVP